jgi:hypothetical protein
MDLQLNLFTNETNSDTVARCATITARYIASKVERGELPAVREEPAIIQAARQMKDNFVFCTIGR